jgi:hypothetical protein
VVETGGHLKLTQCEVRGNRVVGGCGVSGARRGGAGGGGGQAGVGGAILCLPGSVLESNECKFMQNSACGGGGGSAFPNDGLFNAAGGAGGGCGLSEFAGRSGDRRLTSHSCKCTTSVSLIFMLTSMQAKLR